MSSVGTYEAKTQLPALLKRVEAGETITITNHGRAVARLVPVEDEPEQSISEILQEMLANRISVGPDFDVKQAINEGRR